MPASVNKTKVTFYRGQDATAGGFVNVASLMNDVVKNMVTSGFKVVYATKDDTTLNTVAWGTLSAVGGALTWPTTGSVPAVGAPLSGSAKISSGPTASITLEAGPNVDYLNPAVAYTGGTYPKEPWRVKFELLSTECVAAYVATPLQLPGFSAVTTTLTAESWGFPGSNSKITDSAGIPLDAAGATGAKQNISSYSQVTGVVIGSGGTGYNVGDYIIENAYTASVSPGTTGITVGVSLGAPPPDRVRAIFKVETVTAGAVKSVSIVNAGKYIGGAAGQINPGPTLLYGTGTGTGCTLVYSLSSGCAGVDETDSFQGLYNRGTRVGANGASYPLTYELAVTNSGFFLGIYESNWATQVGGANIGTPGTVGAVSGRFNWMLCQRPVDRSSGRILDNYESTYSKHPVFCVNGVGGRYYTFVVREKDISHPTAGPDNHSAIKYYDATGSTTGTLVSPYTSNEYLKYTYRTPASLNSEDNHLLFNPENQISLTEDKKYLVTFPHNLSTPRFRYTEELDLIGFTSADVLMTGQEISILTYQYTGSAGDPRGPSGDPATARTYLALPPSGQFNTGLRICVVKATGNT